VRGKRALGAVVQAETERAAGWSQRDLAYGDPGLLAGASAG
jgi:hypothetical protein